MASSGRSLPEREARLEALPWHDAGAPVGLFRGTSGSIREIWERRELLGMLTRRELKARYKDSALGFLWSLARPLTQLLIYYVVVGQFLGAAQSIQDFAIYVFAGLTIYTLFSEIVATGTGSIIANGGLVKKVYLPREIFPLASVGSSAFNFVIQLVILVIAASFAGSIALGFPLLYGLGALLLILIYGTAFALLLSAVNVYLRDIQYLVEVVLLLLMWASPIVYSLEQVAAVLPPVAMEIFIWNPITLAVLGFHVAFWSPTPLGIELGDLAVRMGIAGAVGIALLFIAQRVFAKLQGDFAQEL